MALFRTKFGDGKFRPAYDLERTMFDIRQAILGSLEESPCPLEITVAQSILFDENGELIDETES